MPQAIVTFAFGSAFAGTTAGLALQGVIGIGLSLGIGYVANEFLAPETPGPEDVQGLVRQSVTSRLRHYGRVKVGGVMAFIETDGDGTLWMVVMHGQGEAVEYQTTYLDDREVNLNGSGGVTTNPFDPSDQVIKTFFGTSGQSACDILVSAFPGIWTNDHRLRGVAYSCVKAKTVDAEDVQEVYPNRIPALQRVAKWSKCYDPRDGQTDYTDNGALILRDYLTHEDGMNLPGGWMDDDYFAPAANVCGQNLTTKDGSTIDRYAIGLSYAMNEEPIDVIGRILTATDGRLFLTGEGKIAFQAGQWIEPTVRLTDAEIIDWNLTDGAGPFREVNEVIVQYTQVPVGFKQATSDPWRNEVSISQLGDVRSKTIPAYEIQHHNHARRIAKLAAIRGNPRWTGSIRTNLMGLNAWDQRFIEIAIADLDIDTTFEIIGSPQLDVETMTVVLPVQSFPEDGYAFNAASEEGTEPKIPDVIDNHTLPDPQSVVANLIQRKIDNIDTSYTYWDPELGTNVPFINTKDVHAYFVTVRCDQPGRKGLQAEAQFSIDGGDSWNGMIPTSKDTKFETPAMPRGYEVWTRMRWRTTGGGKSDYVRGSPDIDVPA